VALLITQNDKSFWYYGPKKPVVPQATLADQSDLEEITRNRTADGTPLPLVYGKAQVGGRLFAVDYNSTTKTWTLGYLLCYGEIESIDQVWINGEAPVSGISEVTYTGNTSQAADPLLAAAISGYTDSLVVSDPAGDFGIAYVVIQYTDSDYDSWPEVVCEISGKKVYNPKTGFVEFSENPALHLADLIKSPIYGLGRDIDDTSLKTLQDYCDDTAPTEVRRKSFTVIDRAQETERWVDVLRAYAAAWVVYRGNTAYFVADKPASSVMTLSQEDIVEGSLQINQLDASNLPTVVIVQYTDTTEDRWKTRDSEAAMLAGVSTGAVPWRESRVRMPGVTRHSQAYREAVERLNLLQASEEAYSFVMFAEGLQLEIGDVITVSHPLGLSSQLMRIAAVPIQVQPDQWRIEAVKYDAGAYSDVVNTNAPGTGGRLPVIVAPAAPAGLSASEVIYQLSNGQYASRINANWTAAAGAVTGYNVTVTAGANLVWAGTTVETEISTGPLQEGVTYSVLVRAFNSTHISGAATTAVTVSGDTATPAAPTALGGSNNNAVVDLSWTESVASNVDRYEVRYYATTGSWTSGTVLGFVKGTTFTTANVPEGTWRFGVKAVTSVGNTSSGTATVDVTVAASASGGSGITTFYQAAPPTADGVGDIWYETDDDNEPHRWNGSSWVSVRDGSIAAALSSAESYADATAAAEAAAALSSAESYTDAAVDGKVTTFYQSTQPTADGTGDLWIDTTSDRLYRWSGSLWVAIQDEDIAQAISDAATAQNTADGKIVSFYQSTQPTADGTGDLWIDTNDGNRLYRWSGFSWVSVRDSTIADAQADASAAITAASNAQATADGKVTTFYQSAQPTADGVGDLWIDTDDGNKLYRWSGSVWASVQDAEIGQAISDAATAQNTADGKIVSFYQPTQPTAEGVGDFWVDTDDGNKLYRWSGSSWVSAQDQQIQNAIDAAADAQSTADGKIITFFQSADPASSATEGDLWVDTGDGNKLYRRNASNGWDYIKDSAITAAQDTADSKITTYFQSSAPSSPGAGDFWVDTSPDPDIWYRRNDTNTAWVRVDGAIVAAQSTADGKNTIYRAASAPSGADEGDIWYDTDDDNRTYRYESGSWVDIDVALDTAKQAKVFVETAIKTSSFTATTSFRYPCDTSSGAFTLTLPASPSAGDTVFVFDAGGSFDVNNLTVGRNGSAIMGFSENLVVDVRFWSGGFQYVNASFGWALL